MDDSKPRPPFWATTTCKMAARQFGDTSTRTFAQQTRITKMIYDHYYHGENRIKGITDTTLRIEKGSCHLCSNSDSEEHYVLQCTGPSDQTDILSPIRDQVAYDITRLIDTLKPGLTRTLAERYRDLALHPPPVTPQPQRVWKGLLSANQLRLLLDIPSVNPQTPNKPGTIKILKSIQKLLAAGFYAIRGNITSLTYPHKRCSPTSTPPTHAQHSDINTRLSQTTILEHFTPSTQQPSSSVFRRILHSGKTRSLTHVYARGSRTKPTSLDTTPLVIITTTVPPYIPLIPTLIAVSHPLLSPSSPATLDMTHTTQPSLPVHNRQHIPRYTPRIPTSIQMTHSSSSKETLNKTHPPRGVMPHTYNAPITPNTEIARQNYSPPLYFYDAQSNNGFQSPPSTLRQAPFDGQLDGD
jgi:hypothetical protein